MYSRPAQAPMPPGWEAKYDPTSRRWFYLNHATKTTQWEDPRLTYQPSPAPARAQQIPMYTRQQQQQPVASNYFKQQAATTSFIEPDVAKQQSLLSKYNVNVDLLRSLLKQLNNREDAVEQSLQSMGYVKKVVADQTAVKMLRAKYPDAPPPTIEDQLIRCNNSVQGAQLGLDALGYKKGGHKTVNVGMAKVPDAQPSKVQAPKAKFVMLKKPEPKKEVDPVKAKRELKKKFPTLDDNTIDLCLKVANNDVEMSTKILEAKAKKDTKDTSKKVFAMAKKVESVVEAPRDLAPKVFGSDDSKKSDEPTTSSESFSVGSYLENKGESLFAKFLDKENKKPVSNSQVRTRQYQAKKKVVKAAVKRNDDYKSSLCIEPVGPNPDLCKGPDPTLLIKILAVRNGPNKGNCKGPQASNRVGPNQAYRHGPSGLAVGPVGPMMTSV